MSIPESTFGSFWYNMSGLEPGNHFYQPHHVRQIGSHWATRLTTLFPHLSLYIKWTLPVLHSPALALLSFHALLQGPHPETTQILRPQLDDPITGPYPAPEFCYHLTSQTSLPLSHLLSGYFPVCLYVPPSLTFSLLNSSMTASPDWVSWLSGFYS